ncbi:MAG: LysM domain-containing protein [Armatimonadetes bacterium]|nr:LysM domain-containing protein [Armatimonadota bacterium]
MFQPNSRYARIPTATYAAPQPDGSVREIRYVLRRFLPPAGEIPLLTEHTVAQGERLDHITARYLGDPEQFWRLCDANDAFQPEELTSEPGRIVRVPAPQG